jgi:hypothetical protein
VYNRGNVVIILITLSLVYSFIWFRIINFPSLVSRNHKRHRYILGKDKGFTFHTNEFIRGYIAAMCKAGISSDAVEATWDCPSEKS